MMNSDESLLSVNASTFANLQSHGAHTRRVCLSKSFWLGSDTSVSIWPFAASVVPARNDNQCPLGS